MFPALDSLKKRLKSKALLIYNLYPPYFGAGIRITHISNDLRTVKVRMPLTRLNKNYVGTQFGGSLYSMCDPFFTTPRCASYPFLQCEKRLTALFR